MQKIFLKILSVKIIKLTRSPILNVTSVTVISIQLFIVTCSCEASLCKHLWNCSHCLVLAQLRTGGPHVGKCHHVSSNKGPVFISFPTSWICVAFKLSKTRQFILHVHMHTWDLYAVIMLLLRHIPVAILLAAIT